MALDIVVAIPALQSWAAVGPNQSIPWTGRPRAWARRWYYNHCKKRVRPAAHAAHASPTLEHGARAFITARTAI